MGQEDILVTAARMATDASGHSEWSDVAEVGIKVGLRVLNPSMLVADGFNLASQFGRVLIVKDGMEAGTGISNDIDLYQAAEGGAEISIAFITVSAEDLGMAAVGQIIPARYAFRAGERIAGAFDEVSDHKEMIRGMAERGVPGFAHEIMTKVTGEVVEVYAHVPLDGGEPVTYVDSYNGPAPLMGRTMFNDSVMRKTLIDEAADSLEHWAMRTEIDVRTRLRDEAIANGENPDADPDRMTITANASVGIAYQQLKAGAIADMTSGARPAPQAETQVQVAGNSATPENLIPEGFGSTHQESEPKETVASAFKDFSI